MKESTKEYLRMLRSIGRAEKAPEKCKRLIEENCLRIRRGEIKLVKFNAISAINWNNYN